MKGKILIIITALLFIFSIGLVSATITPANNLNGYNRYTIDNYKEVQNTFYVTANSATDIQTKIDLCPSTGCTVKIPAGTYNIVTPININNKNNLKLIGEGDDTILNVTDATAQHAILNLWTSTEQQILPSDAEIGSLNVTVLDGSVYSVGDYVIMSSNSVYTGAYGKIGEIKRVREISGNVLTFHTLVYFDYKTSDSAIIRKMDLTENFELANMNIINGLENSGHATGYGVYLNGMLNAKIHDVKISNFRYGAITIAYSDSAEIYRNTLDQSEITVKEYGVTSVAAVNKMSIHDNIFYDFSSAIDSGYSSSTVGFLMDTRIISNRVYGSTQRAIDCHEGTQKQYVEGNYLELNLDSGEAFGGRCQYVTIKNNFVNGMHDIMSCRDSVLDQPDAFCLIDGNTFRNINYATGGFYTGGTRKVIYTNNQMFNATGVGLYIDVDAKLHLGDGNTFEQIPTPIYYAGNPLDREMYGDLDLNGNEIKNFTMSGVEINMLGNPLLNSSTNWEQSSNDIIGEYSFNPNNVIGNTFLDSSGQNLDGTNINTVYNATGGFDNGGAYEFDGANATIDFGSVVQLPADSSTLTFWFKFNGAFSGEQRLFDISDNSGAGSKYLAFNPASKRFYGETNTNGDIYSTCFTSASTTCPDQTQWKPNAGTWYFIAVALKDNSSSAIYIDGVLSSDNRYIVDDGTSFRYLGSDGQYGQPLNGSVSDVKIFNRTLSPSEMKAMYETKAKTKNAYAYRGTDNTWFGTNTFKDILPQGNDTYSLGSATNYWKDLFVGNSTIHLCNAPNDCASLSRDSDNLYYNDKKVVLGELKVFPGTELDTEPIPIIEKVLDFVLENENTISEYTCSADGRKFKCTGNDKHSDPLSGTGKTCYIKVNDVDTYRRCSTAWEVQ